MRQRCVIAVAASLVLCGCLTNRQADQIDQKAEAEIDSQIGAKTLRCAAPDECGKLWDAAQQWAAVRPHRVGFKVKPDRFFVVYMDSARDVTVSFTLDGAPSGARTLNIDTQCADFAVVVVPLSCGMQSKQVTLQAETEIGTAAGLPVQPQ